MCELINPLKNNILNEIKFNYFRGISLFVKHENALYLLPTDIRYLDFDVESDIDLFIELTQIYL